MRPEQAPVCWSHLSCAQVWRWAFFFSGFVPIFWVSRLAVHLLVISVEYAFFTSRVMYYVMALRVRTLLFPQLLQLQGESPFA